MRASIGRHGLRRSVPQLQLQMEGTVTQAHGAGLVRHPATGEPGGYNPELPTADLANTAVHQGLGTSNADPYTRTLPNQPMKQHVDITKAPAEDRAASPDEIDELPKSWGTLRFWMGGTHPRLAIYLSSRKISAAPLPPKFDDVLQQFVDRQLGNTVRDNASMFLGGDAPAGFISDDKLARQAFQGVLKKLENVPLMLNDPQGFEALVHSLCQEAAAVIGEVGESKELTPAAAVISRLGQRAILQRNAQIDDLVAFFSDNSGQLGGGDGVWGTLLRAFADNREELVAGDDAIATLLEQSNRIGRVPEVKAPVAIFLAALSLQLASNLGKDAAAPSSSLLRTIPEEETATAESGGRGRTYQAESLFPNVSADELQTLIGDAFRKYLSSGEAELAQLARVLHRAKQFDAHSATELLRAVDSVEADLVNEKVGSVLGNFAHKPSMMELLKRLMQDRSSPNAKEVIAGIHNAFGMGGRTDAKPEELLKDGNYDATYREIALAMLSDPALCAAITTSITSDRSSATTARGVFTPEVKDALRALTDARAMNTEARTARVEDVVAALVAEPAAAIGVLRGFNVDLKALEAANSKAAPRVPPVPPQLATLHREVIHEMAAAHPNWVTDGVLPADLASIHEVGNFASLRTAMRVFLRLTCPPNAVAATLKSKYRNRVGRVSSSTADFNIPVEVGFSESFDNLLYKTYDRQGWYQRMKDVYQRNVSVRCRLQDMRQLSGNGQPYLDLQSERRLRVLAGERVGRGILKLDSDRYEDRNDNRDFGEMKVQQLMAESKKAQLSKEYWPSVEVKVRRPSGQTKLHYSTMEWDRVEAASTKNYAKYRELKKTTLFVKPTDTWLRVSGLNQTKRAVVADADGYTVDDVMSAMGTDGQE